MHRVSSRPRLVSDADRAFANASVEDDSDIDFPEQDLNNDDDFAFWLGESAPCRDLPGLQKDFREKAAIVLPLDDVAVSSKRKRPSPRTQLHPAPFCRQFPQNTAPRATAGAHDDGESSPLAARRMVPRLDSMPAAEETLVLIASFLTLTEVRAGLAVTCRRLRTLLVTGRGAAVEVWGEALRGGFPQVMNNHDIVLPIWEYQSLTA